MKTERDIGLTNLMSVMFTAEGGERQQDVAR